MTTRTINAPAFKGAAAKFFEKKVEKRFLKMAKMAQYRNILSQVVVQHKSKVWDKFSTRKQNVMRSHSPLADIFGDEMVNSKAYSTFTFFVE